MAGDREDIGDIDSLRKVREVFSCIRMQYRKTQQNIEAIKRQMEANPEAFRQMQEEAQRAGSAGSGSRRDEAAAAEESKEPAAAAEGQEEEKVDEEAKSALEDQVKAKREAIDKQQAFIEFKQSEQGASFEGNIRERRGVLRDKRAEIREVTD